LVVLDFIKHGSLGQHPFGLYEHGEFAGVSHGRPPGVAIPAATSEAALGQQPFRAMQGWWALPNIDLVDILV
jgi:hypothetical protein